MNTIPIQSLILTFGILFIAGTLLTLPLYKFDYIKFFHSQIFVKILVWIPIFALFIGVLYADSVVRSFVLVALIGLALKDFLPVYKTFKDPVLVVYFVVFVLGLAHLFLLARDFGGLFVDVMITLCFATVLADVFAYFCGNYIGRHKLPHFLNNNKSWEGVLGEVVGALAGVFLVSIFIVPGVSIWLFLPIGIGSAIGDLANSFAKRRANIKDWSHAIPGHGGFIDRLSSMSGSAVLMYYLMVIAR